ncbi:MAG: ABC transporter permease subunit [Proteobacteria bacterium]|nr:ABC transporter permease subunit [Pseudomonadota bacterium]
MKKFFLILPILLSFFLTACKQEKEEDIIRFATSADYPPFEYIKNGDLVGFDIDVAKHVAKKLNKKAVFENVQFKMVLPLVQSNKVDAAISTIAKTAERQKIVDFSVPYYFEKVAVVFRKDKPLKTIDSLNTQKIASLLGSVQEIWIKENIKSAKLTAVNHTNQAIESLKAKHVNAVVLDGVQAVEFVKNNTELEYHYLAQSKDGFSIVFKKGSPLKADINKILEEMIKSGEINTIKKKWIEDNASSSTKVYQDIIYYASFIGKGAIMTLQLMAGGFIIGLILGTILSVLRYQKKGVWLINNIISVLRGTPLILQLSFMHFILPSLFNVNFDILTTGIITFGINSAAYVSEILRGGIENLPKGQFEAAFTLHIPKYYMWKDIILPQVIRNIFPTLVNETTNLLKETAIISMIGGVDIMRQVDFLSSEKCTYFIPLCIAGMYYYFLVLFIEWMGRVISRKAFSC